MIILGRNHSNCRFGHEGIEGNLKKEKKSKPTYNISRSDQEIDQHTLDKFVVTFVAGRFFEGDTGLRVGEGTLLLC